MEKPNKMDDLGGNPLFFGNLHITVKIPPWGTGGTQTVQLPGQDSAGEAARSMGSMGLQVGCGGVVVTLVGCFRKWMDQW